MCYSLWYNAPTSSGVTQKTAVWCHTQDSGLVSHTSLHIFAFLDLLHLVMSCLPEDKMGQCRHVAITSKLYLFSVFTARVIRFFVGRVAQSV